MDGFLVVTPYYNKPPQRGIVAHVEAVAAATDRPVVFYDIPSRVVVDAEPATISRSAEIANVPRGEAGEAALEAARHVVGCGLDLYAATTTSSSRSSRSAASAASACTRTSSARR